MKRIFAAALAATILTPAVASAQLACSTGTRPLDGAWVLRVAGVMPVEQTVSIDNGAAVGDVPPLAVTGTIPALPVTGTIPALAVAVNGIVQNNILTVPRALVDGTTAQGELGGGTTAQGEVFSTVTGQATVTAFEPFWRLCRLNFNNGVVSGNCRGGGLPWFLVAGEVELRGGCHVWGNLQALARSDDFAFHVNATMAWGPAMVHGFLIDGVGEANLDDRPAHAFTAQRTRR